MMQMIFSRLKLDKNRIIYLLLFLFCGILLMIFPSETKEREMTYKDQNTSTIYTIENEEQRLQEILSSIEGVGECRVLLSVHNRGEAFSAEQIEETVKLTERSKQSSGAALTHYPAFQGAVIVSGGSEDPSIRYDILKSVMAYTGLEVDKITICPIKNS